jgi:hypothetical protein
VKVPAFTWIQHEEARRRTRDRQGRNPIVIFGYFRWEEPNCFFIAENVWNNQLPGNGTIVIVTWLLA